MPIKKAANNEIHRLTAIQQSPRNSLCNRDATLGAAGDLGHEQLKSPASTPSIY